MKRALPIIVFLSAALNLYAGTKVVFTPQWTPQSQFAGFYMALEKGYYAEEGLDVVIDHSGIFSSEDMALRLIKGETDIMGQQLLQSIISRSDGMPIVNVMQTTQVSGLCCVSRKPISKPEDLDGMTVGRWRAGYSEFCDIMEATKGVSVKWVPFINGINLYVFGAVDATLCYSYSEYIALKLAIGEIPEENFLRFADHGYDCPEDGLYVTEDYYRDNKETIDKFVRASKRGWEYVRNHIDEAVALSMKYVKENNIVTNETHQRMMLETYLSLQVNPDTGKVDYAPVKEKVYNDIINALMETGYITNKPAYKEIIR